MEQHPLFFDPLLDHHVLCIVECKFSESRFTKIPSQKKFFFFVEKVGQKEIIDNKKLTLTYSLIFWIFFLNESPISSLFIYEFHISLIDELEQFSRKD